MLLSNYFLGAQSLWRMGLVAPRHVGSSRTRDRTHVPCNGRQILNRCATREVPGGKHFWAKSRVSIIWLWALWRWQLGWNFELLDGRKTWRSQGRGSWMVFTACLPAGMVVFQYLNCWSGWVSAYQPWLWPHRLIFAPQHPSQGLARSRPSINVCRMNEWMAKEWIMPMSSGSRAEINVSRTEWKGVWSGSWNY